MQFGLAAVRGSCSTGNCPLRVGEIPSRRTSGSGAGVSFGLRHPDHGGVCSRHPPAAARRFRHRSRSPQTGPDGLAAELNPHKTELNP